MDKNTQENKKPEWVNVTEAAKMVGFCWTDQRLLDFMVEKKVIPSSTKIEEIPGIIRHSPDVHLILSDYEISKDCVKQLQAFHTADAEEYYAKQAEEIAREIEGLEP